MRVPSGIFLLRKIHEVLRIVSFCIIKTHLCFRTLEGHRLERSRLVFPKLAMLRIIVQTKKYHP